jgi:mRNA-degrading endonuclease toxin of MazEF toxin-antitoxin module
MTFSRGDVVWLRTDNLEGGLGKRHPAVVVSNDNFNDSHNWGYIVRGSHTIPATPEREEVVIKRNRENGLAHDTVFSSILQSAKWKHMQTAGGKVRPIRIEAGVRSDQVDPWLATTPK